MCTAARRVVVLAALLAGLGALSPSRRADAGPDRAPPLAAVVEGAEVLGDGLVTAYRKGAATWMLLPKDAFERTFLWYAETVSVPTEVVDNLNLGTTIVRLDRRGDRVLLLDVSATFGKRVRGQQAPEPGRDVGHEIDPMAISVRRASEPPVVAVLPVVAASPEGRVLVDVTRLFADDPSTMSARGQVVLAGSVPLGLDPTASFVTSVRVFPDRFGVRALLTFAGKPNPADAASAVRNVSLRVGHSFVALPERPMQGRLADPRVGFFTAGGGTTDIADFSEYGGDDGRVLSKGAWAVRFRLEKQDPTAAVSDPVTPIVFYVGREVPVRWRPYLKQAVEMWRPAFEAAGFSNAIVAKDAPSFEEDPSWTPEDARHNVIRWLAQPRVNARGPHILDPRSGEILGAHIEVWPDVLQFFGRYYFAVAGTLDPRATTLPLPDDLAGELLRYAVAHEVGHTLGLRHNHLASTAYTVAQLRDPAFANRVGPNASIMAYGRLNQAAQPGDGVTRLHPGIGPYDLHAIAWGYAPEPADAAAAARREAALVAAQADRALQWAAGETPAEASVWAADPRVQKENIGAERVEATRLGVANVMRAVARLVAVTHGDDGELRAAVDVAFGTHVGFLKSVGKEVGGAEAHPFAADGPTTRPVPAARQRAAVQYLLGEGARSLEAYLEPALAARYSPFGTTQLVRDAQEALVAELVDAPRLVMLADRVAAGSGDYGAVDLVADVHEALWSDLSTAPAWKRALQRGHLATLAKLFTERTDPAGRQALIQKLSADGLQRGFAAAAVASVDATDVPGWARGVLPELATRLDEAAAKAASASDRYHFRSMAGAVRRVAALP